MFPNTTDIGMSREAAYAEFLRAHLPSKCNVTFGGFVFGNDGSESGQIDVIVSTDTTPRFKLDKQGVAGKSFAPVEGTLAVAAIKSTLNKAVLEDALIGFARIPATGSLKGRVNPLLTIGAYDDWPYKILYATNGIGGSTLLGHLHQFYAANPDVPLVRRPNIIHVVGQYVVFRMTPNMAISTIGDSADIENPVEGEFRLFPTEPDVSAIAWTLDAVQSRANDSTHIIYRYNDVLNGVLGSLRTE